MRRSVRIQRRSAFTSYSRSKVERTPDAVALVFEDEELTYRELNARANQLAHHLRGMGVGAEVLVGVMMERSLEMVVAVLGILKAGGAYVPLDPQYPQERLSFMLKDASVTVLLTQERLRGVLPGHSAQVVCLDTDWVKIAQESEERVVSRVLPENLVYVIYTSGSTGTPKGVAMKHNSLANLIHWQCSHPLLSTGKRRVQFASLSFDASFREIFSTLCSGGILLLISEDLRADITGLASFIADQEVEKILVPFVVLEQLADELSRRSPLPYSLREIITAGEQLRITETIERLFSELEGRALHNHYGPTETHVATAMMLSGSPQGWARFPPIGRPIANTEIYLLDRQGEAVPVGVAGEVYIGGAGVARGYLHRAELTAERFIPHPFSKTLGQRLYRTGDLARYLADGNIEFLGRIDHQVKVRGYRIELGEIESVLAQHPSVREVILLAREDAPGEKRLVAYIVAHPEPRATVGEFRDFLRERLPQHMIPSSFVQLDELPLTPNRKVDRRALPAPEGSRPEMAAAFVAPRTAAEEIIAGIWCEVLKVERVSIHDNFFELGGHSLLATQVISRLREAFQIELPLRRLFEEPTVSGLLDEIAQAWGGMEIVEEIARTIKEIKQLPEENVKHLLLEQ
jgi:amino acid adenylation domain-containing protein